MKKIYIRIFILISILTTCKERTVTNPYDTRYNLEPPKILAANEISNNEFYISWEKHYDNISHVVIYKSSNNNAYIKLISIPADQLYFLDNDYSPDSLSRYAVSSKADKNESEIYYIENDDYNNPYGNLSGIKTFSTNVKLNWTTNLENIKTITIQRKTEIEDNFINISTVNNSVTEFIDENVNLCTEYSYRIKFTDIQNTVFYLNPVTLNIERTFEKRIESKRSEYSSGILKTTAGDFIVYGHVAQGTSNCIIKKINNDGNLEWEKIFDVGFDEQCTSALLLKDESIIICCKFRGINNWYDCNSVVRKIDSNGNLIWTKIFDGNYGIAFYSIVETNDTELLLGGKNSNGFGSWLIKLDENGGLLWSKFIPSTYEIYSLLEMNDGNFLLTGHGGTYTPTLIAKIDNQGNIIWENSYSYKEIISTIKTIDNNYISITSNYSNRYLLPVYIINSNSNGDINWIHEIPGRSFPSLYPNSIIQTNDGQYLFSAIIDIKIGSELDLRIYLRKIDQSGNQLWEYTFDEIVELSDNRKNMIEDDQFDLILLSTQKEIIGGLKNDFSLKRIINSDPFCGD